MRIDQLVAHIARAAASCEMRRGFLRRAVARATERDRRTRAEMDQVLLHNILKFIIFNLYLADPLYVVHG